ncbi:hypothetical protein SAMN02745136_05000 [Anaerocolumna jejuensis DSM 15929]|jgi:hypothetical protein|uniref:Uncharacterized protein n=1 Tax=Anaerocolumna jejuensis DSM 15929 TaxID=1121322 RepID=A0A1M7AZW5_9FIRM|nr:hypothetical protein SAMN02745136_05000 [Anaerocolumna jejuensis DSM 15929]
MKEKSFTGKEPVNGPFIRIYADVGHAAIGGRMRGNYEIAECCYTML